MSSVVQLAPCFVHFVEALAAAAPIAGVESRNENRAADSRVRLRNRPAEIVMPLREQPGTTASACASADRQRRRAR